MSNIVKLIVLSFLSTFIFISLIYNLNSISSTLGYWSENRTAKYSVIMFFYFLFYLSTRRTIQVNDRLRFIIIFGPPFLIDLSVVFTAPNLIPLRFPFATIFPLLGVSLGFTYHTYKSKAIGLLIIPLLAFIYCSDRVIVPNLIHYIEKRQQNVQVRDAFLNSEFVDVNSRKVMLSDITNVKCTLLDLFFVGCPPCENKKAVLLSLARRFPGKDFKIVMICSGKFTTYEKFLEYTRAKSNRGVFTYLYDPNGQILNKFMINKYPLEILLNRKHVEHTLMGFNIESSHFYLSDETERIQKIIVGN